MPWRKTIWRELTFIKAAALAAAAWAALPSALFLQPQAVTVRAFAGAYEVDFSRATPLGAVRASWHTELHSRRECDDQDDGLTYYEARGLRAVPYRLSDKLARCLEPDAPFSMTTTHTVFALGLIPLRPVVTIWHCPALGVPCEAG